jgi:hypothetical protein
MPAALHFSAMRLWRSICFLAWGLSLASVAIAEPILEAEVLQPPTAKRLEAIMAAAQRESWAAQAAPLRAAAQQAYRSGKLGAAEAWFTVYRWMAVFGVNDIEYNRRWKETVQAAHLWHENMPRYQPTRGQSLGYTILPELQLWLLGNASFSDEFFATVTPVDYLPGVLQILGELNFNAPDKFKRYPSLALAIAVVYDVPPPPYWPHGQVSKTALPRQLPRALDAFKWWTKQDESGLTFHRLDRLGADELKFVVDATASFADLEWSQQIANYPLPHLGKAYTMVRYDAGRVQRNEVFWTGDSYGLDTILAAGGICVDQGYFAAQVGKARGVPTLLFRGQGTDSRHAWFGFLDGKEKWELDVGRYAEQRFVTGYAVDPQTWRNISDHELKFLSERFRTKASFRLSRLHTQFAGDFMAAGDAASAATAARKAIDAERRNHAAWEVLLAAEAALGRDALQREATLREAVATFVSYPDLEAVYASRLSESLRARGDGAAADAEQSRIAQKNQRKREDLSLVEAQRTLLRSLATQPVTDQVVTYQTLLAGPGRGAGIAFFDQIVRVFVEHLMRVRETAEAARAVEAARSKLKVDGNSQLARDLDALAQRVKSGP